MQTHLYLVRHAHSVYSTDERNRPLSEQGFSDAQKVAEALKGEEIDHVLSSPYKRAIQTVEVLAAEIGQEVKVYEDFKERLLSETALTDFDSAIARVWEDEQFAFPGGESNSVAQKRGAAQVMEVLKGYAGKRVAIGMHGNLMVLIMNYFDADYHVDFWRKLQMPDIYCLSFEGTELVAVKQIPLLLSSADRTNLQVRRYCSEDTAKLVDLFYETVHSVNAAHYTAEQLHAWTPMGEKEERIKKWRVSLAQNLSFVAEQKGKIVGFSDLQQDGYLNRLYVHKDHQRQGVAADLLNAAEKEAEKLGLSEITLDASLTAKPFFEKHGYETIRQQTVVRKGIALTNFKMRKTMD